VNTTAKIVAGSGIGAALMFLLDPAKGSRRRALARDQAVRLAGRGRTVIEKAGRDLANRATGAVAATKSRFRKSEVDDSVLEARVRTHLGRSVSHPGSIDVTVEDGAVTLRGLVLRDETDDLLKEISSVPGVRRVRNELEVHDQPGDVPGLQGIGKRREARSSWPPGIRLLAGTAGGLLAAWGIARRDPVSLAAAAIGATLVTGAVTNRSVGIGEIRQALSRGREAVGALR
jgi:hypothetical protein